MNATANSNDDNKTAVQRLSFNLMGHAPTSFSTLYELALALGDDTHVLQQFRTSQQQRQNQSDMTTALKLKANQYTTYTDTEVDTQLSIQATVS